MKDIDDFAEKLDQISQNLSEQNDRYVSATKQLAAAVGAGQDDEPLMLEVSESRQAYRSTKIDAVKFVQECQELLGKEANEARRYGVELPKLDAESLPLNGPDDYEHKLLIQSIVLIKTGMISLSTAINNFEIVQLKIQQYIEELKSALQRLTYFHINIDNDKTTLKSFEDRFVNVKTSRNVLLNDISNVLLTWQERLCNSLQSKALDIYAKLETELKRLQSLGAATEIDSTEIQKFKDDLQSSENENLEHVVKRLESLLHDWQQRANLASRQLNETMENLMLEAKCEIDHLHPLMPEVVALNEFLAKSITIEEDKLFSYREQLEVGVMEVKNANNNAIKRFQIKIQEDSEYIFSQQEEVAILGTAIVNLACESDQYAGPLWWLGAEIMLRLGLSEIEGMNEQDFYEKYGYVAIANAITTATRNNVFTPILSLFSSDFLPAYSGSSQDNITTLLEHFLIKQALKEAIEANTLRLNPEEFHKFGDNKQKAILILLNHENELELPISIRLQWAALLHNSFDTGSKEHFKSTHLLLDALLASDQYLSLYYALRALESCYPDLWAIATYRPMLFHIILHALNTEVFETEIEGRKFLVELCLQPGVRQLAKGDLDTELLLASLTHHAAVRWDRLELVNDAWAAWDKLSTQYPVFGRILQRELQGERFGVNIMVNMEELRHQLDDTINDLAIRMLRPGNTHPIGYQIQNWYVDHYMNSWLALLKDKELPEPELDQLMLEISTLLNIVDLAEATDIDLSARTSGKSSRSWTTPDKFRLQVNRRLFELLDSFQQAVRIRKQINVEAPVQTVSREELRQELIELYGRSQLTKWTLEHLLAPGLPFIHSMLCID